MDNNPNPLTYHYESRLKLDHFLLGADVALLGWTVVNLEWLPVKLWFEIGIVVFWLLILLSLLLGTLRQRYTSEAFGLNSLILDAGEKASFIERNTMSEGTFINQQTGESITATEFRKNAETQRKNQKIFEHKYNEANNRAAWLGNWSFYFLIAGLCVLATLRILVFVIK